jgi:ribosomal protein S18 acetylase RimI-like enzyme
MPDARPTAPPELTVRPASPADFPAIEAIAVASHEPTTSIGWPAFFYLEHLLEHGTLRVAERDGALLGYGAAMVVGGARPAAHITDLFVDPAVHGQGAGGAILRELMATVPVRDWHTCSSSDPRAMTLYARAGMQPRWPVIYLSGPVVHADLAPDPGAETAAIDPAAAAETELGWSGRDLTTHYRHWAERPPGGTTFALSLDGQAAAVGTCRDGRFGPGRVLDHLAVAPDADPERAVLAAVASRAVRGSFADASPDPSITLKLALPGPNPALLPLLARGFRIQDHDTFMATRADLIDPTRTVLDPSFG